MSQPKKTVRPLVIAAVMASMAMVAIEATIVSTAMPQIATQLGGLNLYSWVFSSFLLTQTALTVVFDKLADLYGRKPALLVGIAIFLAGSILAGFAWSMPAMIVFRLVQGVGAGAILPVALTVVGDLYPARERGKVQGYLASVWATCAVLGPMVGAFLIRQFSWAWIFWINIPIGILAAALFIAFLHEEKRHDRPSIDLAGACLFTTAVAALMMALTDAGSENHSRVGIEIAVLIVASVLFVFQERRAADPMISFGLWAHRPIASSNAATLLAGMAMMGLTTFLPMYVQGVMHRSPVEAGLTLTMMMMIGPVFIPLGALPFVLLSPQSNPVWAGIGSAVLGFGMGITSVSCLILIQEIVKPMERGSATASNLFSRNLGNTLGAAVFGAVQNYGLTHVSGGPAVSADQLKQLLTAAPGASIATSSEIRFALHHALHMTFTAMFVIAVSAVIAMMFMPAVEIGRTKENVAKVDTDEATSAANMMH
ncbi:drug resistance transporter, EmrB/QacA family [Candidatus Burkholderia verschuerenii]|uniref:MFS-type drug efflux transporter P55 n=1 Tax=Candidatus Burkholderia verschuerenii TaxID=242163 RepID=A0A0L0MID9_9BURK|nr:MFS transporter [Candidatus Burkholderia verschuerenii]KND62467.1 drug resistance transporter, EmrB/QacA family [Candidatus Burkholderia verschuerenii]